MLLFDRILAPFRAADGGLREGMVAAGPMLATIQSAALIGIDAFSVTVPILEQVLGWGSAEIRSFFESNGLRLHEWEKARTDRVIIRESSDAASAA